MLPGSNINRPCTMTNPEGINHAKEGALGAAIEASRTVLIPSKVNTQRKRTAAPGRSGLV